jgi:hypothetical protein
MDTWLIEVIGLVLFIIGIFIGGNPTTFLIGIIIGGKGGFYCWLLILIADTQIGLAAFNHLDPESGMNLREKQVYDNFLSAIDAIIKQKPGVLVHAGDLFDTVRPRTRAYTTVLEALDRLNAAGIPS